jgi:hypothetical protein
MIADSARVVLADGTMKAAIDLYPGGELLTIRDRKLRPVLVVGKTVENYNDVVCLILSNGQRLIGSRDQRVSVLKKGKAIFREMADVEIGMSLQGAVAGAKTVVQIIGTLYFARKCVRLVGFQFSHDDCFIAEGILCRA